MSTFAEQTQKAKFGLDKPDPHKPKPADRTVLTIDEVMELVSEIAKNGEGADRFRALKMLASSTGSVITLPDPLPKHDLVDRLARLIKAAGRDLSQTAYTRAFPQYRKKLNEIKHVTEDHVDPDLVIRARGIRSLKHFYREFPEVKRHGFPPGYPVGRGLELQQEWLRRKALQMLVDRAKTQMSEGTDANGAGEQGPDPGTESGREETPPS